MTKEETIILQSSNFVKRLFNYDYQYLVERITTAWIDAKAVSLPEDDFSQDFLNICKNITMLRD